MTPSSPNQSLRDRTQRVSDRPVSLFIFDMITVYITHQRHTQLAAYRVDLIDGKATAKTTRQMFQNCIFFINFSFKPHFLCPASVILSRGWSMSSTDSVPISIGLLTWRAGHVISNFPLRGKFSRLFRCFMRQRKLSILQLVSWECCASSHDDEHMCLAKQTTR